jgi:Ca2+-binding EF-hand superfamily protein
MTVSAIGQGMSMASLFAFQKPNAKDMVSQIFKDLDTDGDGALSTDEVGKAGKHAKDILGADTDGDGIVTQDELLSDITNKMNNGMMSLMGAMQPPSADDMANHIIDELDTDGDGQLSTDEISAGGDRAQRILKDDADGDGYVTKDELVAGIQKNMSSNRAQSAGGEDSDKSTDPADANKDGVVTMAELIAYISQTLPGSQTTESQFDSLV